MKKMLFIILFTGSLLTSPKTFSQIFISFGTTIPGESTMKGHETEIEAMSITDGFSNPATMGSAGTGASVGKVSFSQINFMKSIGKASPGLINAICTGKHFDKVLINFFIENPVTHVSYKYLMLTLETVFIGSLQHSAAANERPAESVSLSFGKITWNYYTVDASGAIVTAPTASWNVITNTAQ